MSSREVRNSCILQYQAPDDSLSLFATHTAKKK